MAQKPEQLWAPWRMQFIDETREHGACSPFVALYQSNEDRKNLVLFRGQHCFVLMNRYPYSNGHLLILPIAQKAELDLLSKEESAELMQLTTACVQIVRSILHADGANCGINLGKAAGAGILGHVHMHVVPRWVGDSNFMPVIGGTRCMPEYLEATYDKLLPSFQGLKL